MQGKGGNAEQCEVAGLRAFQFFPIQFVLMPVSPKAKTGTQHKKSILLPGIFCASPGMMTHNHWISGVEQD